MHPHRPEPSIELDDLARAVIGAAIEVHYHLGPGYLESVYQRALATELTLRRVPFQAQLLVEVPYKNAIAGEAILDFLVADALVVELKAVDQLIEIHRAQVISYLKAGNFQLGLLINFNVKLLKDGVRRIIWR
jgi:GxxExxY protein